MSWLLDKIPDQHLNVWLFSNPGDNVQKRWRTTGQICPILLTRIWTLSSGLENNHTLKCWSSIFPTILTYMIMLENCQNNISVYGCSPIQGTKLYSCWNLMKPRSQSGTYTPELAIERKICMFMVFKVTNMWPLMLRVTIKILNPSSGSSQPSIIGVGLTKPLTTSLNPTSKHSSHLRKPRKGKV